MTQDFLKKMIAAWPFIVVVGLALMPVLKKLSFWAIQASFKWFVRLRDDLADTQRTVEDYAKKISELEAQVMHIDASLEKMQLNWTALVKDLQKNVSENFKETRRDIRQIYDLMNSQNRKN